MAQAQQTADSTAGDPIGGESALDESVAGDESATGESAGLDLDAIERDLAGVEVALTRLDAGSYWTDEVTGAELPATLLEQHPTARRAE